MEALGCRGEEGSEALGVVGCSVCIDPEALETPSVHHGVTVFQNRVLAFLVWSYAMYMLRPTAHSYTYIPRGSM